MNQHMPLTHRAARRSLKGASHAPAEVLEDAPRKSALPQHNIARLQITRPTPIQAKLTVGAAHDPAEQEADTMAAHVMRNLQTSAAPQSASEEAEPVQRAPEIRCSGAGLGAFDAGPEVEAGIQSARGGGQSLPPSVSGQMGKAFGADFSGVRVHADSHADGLSRSIQAKAFTTGNDIFFSQGTYSPASRGGQELLAHELTHVVQQGGGAKNAAASRSVLPPIRRWDINKAAVPWDKTTDIRLLPSGQPVYFLDDAKDDTLVLKGEDTPIGMTRLYSSLHQKIHGTPSVFTKQLTPDARSTFIGLLSKPALTSNSTWSAIGAGKQKEPAIVNAISLGELPANPTDLECARWLQTDMVKNLAKVHVMELLTGKTAGKQSELGDQVAKKGETKSMRQLLCSKSYLVNLGAITATDLFLENQDRVLSGNVGNWMINKDDSISLLDNADKTSKEMWKDNSDGIGKHEFLDMLATGSLEASAKECVSSMLRSIKFGNLDKDIMTWADTVDQRMGVQPRKFMEEHFLAGLKKGRSKLISLLNTKKMSLAGRSMKKAVGKKEKFDKSRNDVEDDQTSYWDRLKARARYLTNLG